MSFCSCQQCQAGESVVKTILEICTTRAGVVQKQRSSQRCSLPPTIMHWHAEVIEYSPISFFLESLSLLHCADAAMLLPHKKHFLADQSKHFRGMIQRSQGRGACRHDGRPHWQVGSLTWVMMTTFCPASGSAECQLSMIMNMLGCLMTLLMKSLSLLQQDQGDAEPLLHVICCAACRHEPHQPSGASGSPGS